MAVSVVENSCEMSYWFRPFSRLATQQSQLEMFKRHQHPQYSRMLLAITANIAYCDTFRLCINTRAYMRGRIYMTYHIVSQIETSPYTLYLIQIETSPYTLWPWPVTTSANPTLNATSFMNGPMHACDGIYLHEITHIQCAICHPRSFQSWLAWNWSRCWFFSFYSVLFLLSICLLMQAHFDCVCSQHMKKATACEG